MPDAIVAIKSGKLLATASFDAMKMACLAAEAAVRYLRGEQVPREIMLPVEIVDPRPGVRQHTRGFRGSW